MNRQLALIPSLPQPITVPATLPMSRDFRAWLVRLTTFLADLVRETSADLQEVHGQINTAVQGVGEAIPSAATISLTNAIHHVTGAVAISTINPPPGFSGPIWLIADAGFTVVTGGNIAAAGAATAGQALSLIFDPATMLWYPVV